MDSGATNNFISRDICVKFGLKLNNSEEIKVRLADGKTVNTTAFTTASLKLGDLFL